MSLPKLYKDRMHAGAQLAKALLHYANDPAALVLALPRGGVPVGFAIARALGLPLDILLVRKLGMPGHEENAVGAVASGGIRVLQRALIALAELSAPALEALCRRELAELARRERRYRAARPPLALAGHTVILVDDGLATGATMRAAIAAAAAAGPARIVVAVPAGAADTCAALAPEVDEFICPVQPGKFHAVSQCYRQFDQTSDEEVIDLLARAWRRAAPAARHPPLNHSHHGGNDETH
jgi:putative phosphoribosyl transferase